MIKNRKGFVISELIIGILLLVIFVLINISLYVNSYKNNIASRRLAQANNLLIKKVEEIQAMDYNDINENSINTNNELDETDIKGKFDISVTYLGEVQNPSDFYTTRQVQTDASTWVDTSVTEYTTENVEYENLIKIVKCEINYNLNNVNENYSISTMVVGPVVEKND